MCRYVVMCLVLREATACVLLFVCVRSGMFGCIGVSSASSRSACKWLAYGMTTVAFMGKWTD